MNEPQASRELQVSKKLEELYQAIDELDKQSQLMGHRLEKVLSPEAPSNPIEKTPPAAPLCEMASTLGEAINHLKSIRGYLVSLEHRLEV